MNEIKFHQFKSIHKSGVCSICLIYQTAGLINENLGTHKKKYLQVNKDKNSKNIFFSWPSIKIFG